MAPGSFQSELGCAGDWDAGCLRSWLQDPDGDGTYTFSTSALPAGSYESKVAINEGWDLNYGAGGVQNGPNIAFAVGNSGDPVTFSWDSSHQGAVDPGETRPCRPASTWPPSPRPRRVTRSTTRSSTS